MSNQSVQAPSVRDAVQAIESFFEPAIKDRESNDYITAKLAPTTYEDHLEGDVRSKLLRKAGNLLQAIHSALKYDHSSLSENQAYDSSLLLAVYKVLDFILLEGVYPSLPSGLGPLQERRSKSLFYRKPDPEYKPVKGRDELPFVLQHDVEPILLDVNLGIEPMLRHRALTDLIVGYAWIAHNDGSSEFPRAFRVYLERLPASTLFASYTSLLKGSKPDWFRSIISEHLALLPLRRDGVRNTIDFIAASYRLPQAPTTDGSAAPSQGPALPLEALQQASKLLSSVPRAMSAEQYFSKIAPQLLALLDSKDEVALRQAASFIIGIGILGKRTIGAPGTIGWKLFAEPLLQAFNPKGNTPRKRKADSRDVALDSPLVAQQSLEQAVQRLSILTLSHPNPGLTGRLIRPILLPLWALSKYRGPSFSSTELSKAAFSLLAKFLNLVGTSQNLRLLADNLAWDGPDDWVFGPGDTGGVAIREREKQIILSPESNMMKLVSQIDYAVQSFCRLLSASKVNDTDLSTLFLHTLNQQVTSSTVRSHQPQIEGNPLSAFAQAKLVQEMMERYQESLVKSSSQVLDLVDHTLNQHLQILQKLKEQDKNSLRPTLASLANITQESTKPDVLNIESHDEDVLMVALSLLNAFSASEESIGNDEVKQKIASILTNLKTIEQALPKNELLQVQIQTAIGLLETKAQSSETRTPISLNAQAEAIQDVQQTLALITSDLASDLPPIRRSALHAMQAIIKSASAPLDVPPLALILLDLIRNEKEEFVYIAAIQTSIQLALRRDLGFLSRLFVGAFQDIQEDTGIDGRLRIGESLAVLADDLGEQSTSGAKESEVIRGIAEPMISVAGRRGQRKREVLERQREQRLQRRKKKEAEQAWGGEVPEVPDQDSEDGEFQDLTPSMRQRRLEDLADIEKIVQGWQNTGYEEDVRIRASALSILGRLFESCGTSMTTDTVSEAVDLILSILALELDASKAILRRAGALCLFSSLKAADTALENHETDSLEVLLNGEQWTKIEKVLKWVRDTEDDGLVRGHTEAVLEGLEAVRMKMIARVAEENRKLPEERLELDGQLKGLSVNPATEREGKANEENLNLQAPGRMRIEELD